MIDATQTAASFLPVSHHEPRKCGHDLGRLIIDRILCDGNYRGQVHVFAHVSAFEASFLKEGRTRGQ